MDEIKLKISYTLYNSIIAKLQQKPNQHLTRDMSTAQKSGTYYFVTLTTIEAKDAIMPILQNLHIRFNNHTPASKRTAIHCQNIMYSINGFAFA